jgi:hypothetical protein
MSTDKEVIAWRVVFEDGSMELHSAEDVKGEPTFGRWVTPLVAGRDTIDLDPDADKDQL